MKENRFERQICFFGKKGQSILKNTQVCIVGVGGIGSHLIQQLAYLGVGSFSIIDNDRLETSNLNRLVGSYHDTPINTPKVSIMEQLIKKINPCIKVNKVFKSLISKSGFKAVKKSDFVFGCLDNDGARLKLNELCVAYEIPYIDTATEIILETLDYGGRVVSVIDRSRCLYCLDLISPDEARIYLENPNRRKDEDDIYGVPKKLLEEKSPAVVTINGIIASIASTEFLLHRTGIRDAKPYLKYNGKNGILTSNIDEPKDGCYCCKTIRGKRKKAELEKDILD